MATVVSSVGSIAGTATFKGSVTTPFVPGSDTGSLVIKTTKTAYPNLGIAISSVMSNLVGVGGTVVDDSTLVTDPIIKSMYMPSVNYNSQFSVDISFFVNYTDTNNVVTTTPVNSVEFISGTDFVVTQLSTSSIRISGTCIGLFNDAYRFRMMDSSLQYQPPTITSYKSLIQYTPPSSTSLLRTYTLNFVVSGDPAVDVSPVQTSGNLYQWIYWTPTATLNKVTLLINGHP